MKARNRPPHHRHIGAAREDGTEQAGAANSGLQQSEGSFRTMYEQAPIGAALLDLDGRCHAANSYLQRILGYDEAELRRLTLSALTHPDDVLADQREFQELLAGMRDSYAVEKRYVHKDGHLLWCRLGAFIAGDRDGAPVIIATLLDVTNRHTAEERYRYMIETAQEGVWQLDASGCTTFVNARMAEMLGYSQAEVVGQFPWSFVPESDRPAAYARQRQWESGLRENTEVRYRRKDGSTLWAQLRSFPLLDAHGATAGAVGMLVDITGQRAFNLERARFAAIVESFWDPIISASPAGLIQSWNEGAAHLYGYSAEEAIGLPIVMLSPPDRLGEAAEIHQAVVQGRHVSQLQTVRRHKDGHDIDVMLTVSPVRDAAGTVVGTASITLDVSTRTRTEAALRESEQKYRLLFENMTAAFALHEMIYDEHARPLDYRYLEVNPAFERLTGVAASRVLGKTVREVMPETEQYWIDVYGKVALSGEPIAYENYSQALGKYYDVFAFSPRRHQFAVVFTDITDRRRAEEALRQSEQDFRLLAENSTDMIARHTPDGTILYVSPACRRLLGYEPEELLGRTSFSLVHADDYECLEQARQRVLAALITDTVACRYRHKDGRYIWLESATFAVRDEQVGDVIEIQSSSRDVTERRRAEEALREVARERAEQAAVAEALSEASAVLATALEPARLYKVILAQMARVVPYSTAHIVVYHDGWAVSAGGYGEPRLPAGVQVARLEEAAGLFPQSPDHAQLLAETRGAPGWQNLPPWVGEHEVRSTIVLPLMIHGEAYGCLIVGSTAPHVHSQRHFQIARAFAERIGQALWNSRLHQLEQERARSAERLASLRSDFVATVSHELRTPLAAVLGYAELLDGYWSELDEEQRRQKVRRIGIAANRQMRLIDDLLQVSTLEAEKLTVQCQEVRISEVVWRAANTVNASYASQIIDAGGPQDLDAWADAVYLEQVMANLIDNAAKYSVEGSPIEVMWAREGTQAVVRVHDHGPGIPAEGREALFTRFGRVPNSHMRAGRVGTGLGLYLGREYAQAMGGTLDLESTGAEGSTFCLRLSACRPEVSDVQGST